jgi:hypothetical protein
MSVNHLIVTLGNSIFNLHETDMCIVVFSVVTVYNLIGSYEHFEGMKKSHDVDMTINDFKQSTVKTYILYVNCNCGAE